MYSKHISYLVSKQRHITSCITTSDMASCYGSISASSVGSPRSLRYLPIRTKLPDGTQVEVDHFRTSEHAAGHRLLNGVIEEASDQGCSVLYLDHVDHWPFSVPIQIGLNLGRMLLLQDGMFQRNLRCMCVLKLGTACRDCICRESRTSPHGNTMREHNNCPGC
ncbi:unnamed protein product [Ectocarpus sp. 13 AM-2016]